MQTLCPWICLKIKVELCYNNEHEISIKTRGIYHGRKSL